DRQNAAVDHDRATEQVAVLQRFQTRDKRGDLRTILARKHGNLLVLRKATVENPPPVRGRRGKSEDASHRARYTPGRVVTARTGKTQPKAFEAFLVIAPLRKHFSREVSILSIAQPGRIVTAIVDRFLEMTGLRRASRLQEEENGSPAEIACLWNSSA